jgi:hypothetical protein
MGWSLFDESDGNPQTSPMTTTLDLPDDVIEDIHPRAEQEGRGLCDSGRAAARRLGGILLADCHRGPGNRYDDGRAEANCRKVPDRRVGNGSFRL